MIGRILFVCTGNAGRSQMAEAMFRRIAPDGVEVLSAGVEPWDDLHPMARTLMAERGLDLHGHRPKHVRGFRDDDLDVVVTIGDRAEAESPQFRTGVRRIHWTIDDPANADGTPDSEAVFRETCRQIENRLPGLTSLVNSLRPRREAVWAPATSTTVFRPEQFQPAVHIPMLADAGFRHIELCCYKDAADFPWENRSAIEELRTIAFDHNVAVVSIHPPDRANLSSLDRKERGTQMDVMRRSLDAAVALGAGALSIHIGYGLPEGDARQAALAVQEESLDTLETEAAGLPVVLCLETLPARSSDVPNTELVELIHGRSPTGLGFVLDTGHCNIAGDLPGLAQKAGRRLQNLHLHDNDGLQDRHQLPGEGTTDWAGFMRDLLASGYEGPLMLEVHAGDSGNIRHELERCRKALETLQELHGAFPAPDN